MLRSADVLLANFQSFSVETTLSGGTYLKMLARASELGYKTRLLYIGTEDIEINMARIRARVLKGGHHVPIEDQLRRYPRSFANLPKAMNLAEECVLFDNSTKAGHRIVGLKLLGTELLTFDPVPRWVVSRRTHPYLPRLPMPDLQSRSIPYAYQNDRTYPGAPHPDCYSKGT